MIAKPRHAVLLALGALLVLPFVASGGVAPANGGFETCPGCVSNSGSLPSLWTAYAYSGGANGVSWSTDASLTGVASVRVSDSNSFGRGIESAKIPVVPGNAYYATAWFKVAAGGGSPSSDLYLQFWDASNVRVGVVSTSDAATSAWQFQAVGGFAPASAVTANVLVYSNHANVGTYHVDAVTLEEA